MLASDVITESRLQLEDTVAEYRNGDLEMMNWLTAGCRHLIKHLPSCLLQEDGTLATQTLPITTLADALVFDDTLLETLASYVCYRAFLSDSEDDHNAKLAATHFQAYSAAL